MKIFKQFFFAFLLSLLALGCAQQRASEPTAEETRRQQEQAAADREKARAAGQEVGSEAREAEVKTRDEREKINESARTTGEKIGQKAREVEIDTRDERAEIKRGAEEAARKIKEGSIKLADKTAAAAAGIKDGWDGNSVNINTASRDSLISAGATEAEAARIIAGRPYSSKSDLLSRNVVSQATYDRIESRVTVK